MLSQLFRQFSKQAFRHPLTGGCFDSSPPLALLAAPARVPSAKPNYMSVATCPSPTTSTLLQQHMRDKMPHSLLACRRTSTGGMQVPNLLQANSTCKQAFCTYSTTLPRFNSHHRLPFLRSAHPHTKPLRRRSPGSCSWSSRAPSRERRRASGAHAHAAPARRSCSRSGRRVPAGAGTERLAEP